MPKLLLATLLALPLLARAELLDAVAVVVNGDVITLSELEERVGPGLPPADAAGDLRHRRETLLRRAADDAVAEKLVEKEAELQGLSPTAAEIDNAVEDVKRANGIDDPTLEKALGAQGLTKQKYRDMLKAQLTRMKVVEYKVKNRISVSEDDVKARYAKMTGDVKGKAELHARDMYLPPGDDRAATKARLEAARQRVVKGERFATVAKELGGPLASSGGDLGWFSAGMMLPELEKVAFALKKGEVSQVFEGGGGYHVVTVDDTRTAGGAKPLSESREEVRQQLMAERLSKATEDYVSELRKTADVEVRLP